MQLIVTQGEVFHRPKWRYVAFFGSVTLIAGLAFFGSTLARGGDGNIRRFSNILNVIVLLWLVFGYRRYTLRTDEHEILMEIQEYSLQVGDMIFWRDDLTGFVLEVDLKAKRIKNIVLVTEKRHYIHTISQTHSTTDLEEFVAALEQKIARLWTYKQSVLEKVGRRLMI